MADYKVGDEGTRSALESALWEYAHNELHDDGFANDLWGCSLGVATAENDSGSMTRDALCTLEILGFVREGIERVRQAQLGTSVQLIVGDEAFSKALDHCKVAIEQAFWERSADDQPSMLATRDAANRLMVELGERVAAEAVA
jgi:hypothetical protein